MPKSIEYNGYRIEGQAEFFCDDIYVGSYTVSDALTGRLVRISNKVVYRFGNDMACNAAVVLGLQYVDEIIPTIVK
jgi:hypothetical protein